ncbi:FAD-binding protein [Bremerella cremea]|uniref:Thioredoxin reductase n=1 Tax=Blastopirellula marina TaxID=124 RepID=A0A2S8FCE6_9BACT|nr:MULTISPECIES: FAD-dependent oxidoreductase [Pirellulaceae]PQO29836.1 thioredoxin reductase [Blastopirellula marina]RCS43138.1 FAD-binding protein [Bremerella cremea]
MTVEMAFPTLDDEQMREVKRLGQRLEVRAETVLIPAGQKDYPFFVIESGNVKILEIDEDHETLIATHGPRAFTGDVDMLTGRSSVFTARAAEDSVVYTFPAQQLRRLLASCPHMSELLLEAFQSRRKLLDGLPFLGVRVIGKSNNANTLRLREFLYKNHVPHTFIELESSEGQKQRHVLDADSLELPIVRCNGRTIGNPSMWEFARCLGIDKSVEGRTFDLAIVGGGPAGLAAAVYAASEALDVLVIDKVGPGGQAGSSSKIENFIGFPSGISGNELASRSYLQALKFGATFIAPEVVAGLESDDGEGHRLRLESGQVIHARCVLVTSGVTYRQLGIPGCTRFEGAGVYYAATSVESRACADAHAVVVGGGNSAGQAAMFLANSSEQVHLLIRGDDLAKSMSAYLCDRIGNHPRIEVHRNTEVDEVCGDDCVEMIRVQNNATGTVTDIECSGLFIFIGARPHTQWLPEDVLLDEKGFVLTGTSFFSDERLRGHWPLDRAPCDLETTRPGILAGGDVRSGSTKRCGFAVGDGSLAVACVHRYLNGFS